MAPGAALPARVVSIRGRGRSASASAGMRRLARLALGRASPRALPRSLVSAASANDLVYIDFVSLNVPEMPSKRAASSRKRASMLSTPRT